MTKRIKQVALVIADTQPVFLHGLSNIFQSHSDIKIVAQCEDGFGAMTAIRNYAPDIALIDTSMPGLNGFDVLAAVNAETLKTKIIFLTASISNTQIMDAISSGVRGVVFKNSSPAEITRGIRKVAAGKFLLPKDLAAAMRGRRVKHSRTSLAVARKLSPRESEVTRLMIKGLTNREIGRQMHLSEGTVKVHLHNIYKKLGVPNRTSLAALMASR